MRPATRPNDFARSSSLAASKGSCTGNKDDQKGSNHVKLKDFNKDFNDGSWQEVVVPLKDLYKDKGAKFDKKTVWEFDIGTYSAEPRNFNIYVDKIAFL